MRWAGPTRFDAKRFLATHAERFSRLQNELSDEIAEHLKTLDIDWSEAPADAANGRLEAKFSYELVEEPSADKEDPVPVNRVALRASVTNHGESAAHRIKALTSSSYRPYRRIEFLFGKIDPGQTIEREVKLDLSYFPRAQNSRQSRSR